MIEFMLFNLDHLKPLLYNINNFEHIDSRRLMSSLTYTQTIIYIITYTQKVTYAHTLIYIYRKLLNMEKKTWFLNKMYSLKFTDVHARWTRGKALI